MDKTSLIDLVNWPAVLAAPRRAGGHIEVMEAIFKGTAEVLASWVDEDYQDGEAFACRFPGGQVAIMTDGFGSCSGCDAWEDASAEDARRMITSLVGSARFFETVDAARTYVQSGIDEEPGSEFLMRAARKLSF